MWVHSDVPALAQGPGTDGARLGAVVVTTAALVGTAVGLAVGVVGAAVGASVGASVGDDDIVGLDVVPAQPALHHSPVGG